MAETIGARIRKRYETAGLSRYEFARQLGVAYTTVVAWERADKPATPGRDNVRAAARLLGCLPADLDPAGEAPARPNAAAHGGGPEDAYPQVWVAFLRGASLAPITDDEERAALAYIREPGGAARGSVTIRDCERFVRAFRAVGAQMNAPIPFRQKGRR